ncbi:MAG: NUDIX domain-containing protein [Chloroflexi bacterium]|nr:NUDIX domain-containing protein [Chloroflexota bacterium]
MPDAIPSAGVGSRQKPEFRPAARVLLIDERDRVLLINVGVPQQANFRLDASPKADRRLWITPGGGLDPGETREDAALRELYEETGLREVDLGPCIWKRRHTWQWVDRWIESDEWFYLLRAPAFEAVPTAPDEWEMQYVLGHRWWSVNELVANKDTETFVPRSLPELLPPVLAGDIPIQPIDVGA